MAVVKFQLPDDQAQRFERLASELAVPSETLAAKLVCDFMDDSDVQKAQIEAGLKALDDEDFATGAELSAIVAKYCKPS